MTIDIGGYECYPEYILLPSLLIPLLVEIIMTLCCGKSENFGCRLRCITLFANQLNQEKCLDLPADPRDIVSFYHKQARISINRKYKYIVLEDAIQIIVQIYVSNMAGLTGFWTLVSPAVGLTNMFLTIRDWHTYNWDDTSGVTRAKRVVLILVQVSVLAFVC